jgi:dTDP-4-amino-4,6-dideoxygalactose transaminase
LEDCIDSRRKMHAFYVGLFHGIEGVTVFTVPNTNYFSNYWLSVILIHPLETNGISRETLRLALEAANIESRPLWKPMHLQPIFCKYPYYGSAVSETLFNNGLCLPSGSNLSRADLDRIEDVVLKLFIK